jgi:hypothetical protein
MHGSGRYFYAVFMCHLSIEKALKGLFTKSWMKCRQKHIIFGTVHFCLKAWQVIMWSASSVMMHTLTGVNALLKMFYTTKEIIGNCPKMNRL